MDTEGVKTQDPVQPVSQQPVSAPINSPAAEAPAQTQTHAQPVSEAPVTQENKTMQPPIQPPAGGSSIVMRVAIVLLVLALLGVIGYVAYSMFLTPPQATPNVATEAPTETLAPTPVASESATPFATTTPMTTASSTPTSSSSGSPKAY